MDKKIYCKKFVSKKTGKPVYAIYIDFGYTRKFLTFDYQIVAEVLDISIQDLLTRDDFDVCVGSIVLK